MKSVDLIVRCLLALPFVLYGASKFYAFMPTPPITREAALFLGALISTGYMWKLVGLVEILGALFLVFQRTSNLGLLLLGPVILHIVCYLLWLQSGIGPAPVAMSLFLMTTFAFLVFRRRGAWLEVLGMR